MRAAIETPAAIRPSHMAHLVIKTGCYEESVAWYRKFFDPEVVFADDFLTLLTYDDEHHRIAIVKPPDVEPHNDKAAGIDHVAFSFASMADLVSNYERLKNLGIQPFWCINHGHTTSMYYQDPDGAQIEIQVHNTAADTVDRPRTPPTRVALSSIRTS